MSTERAKQHWDPDAVAERIAAVLTERKGIAERRRIEERRTSEQEFQERTALRGEQAAFRPIPSVGLDPRESVSRE